MERGDMIKLSTTKKPEANLPAPPVPARKRNATALLASSQSYMKESAM